MRAFGLEITRAAPLAPVHDNRGGWFPVIRESFTGAWQRNKEIRPDSVLAHHAVYSCVTRIAQDVGKLWPRLVEKDEDSIWTETTSPSFSPVLFRPNRFQNHIQFKEWWITSKMTRGNTYVLLERDGRGIVVRMYILDPARVTVMMAPDGEVFYDLRTDNVAGLETDRVAVPASEIVHDRINCLFHPLVGVSPIFACGTAANLGLEIESNSTAFFGNGSSPSGILSSPQDITPAKSRELSEIWNSEFSGQHTGRVAVLGNGLKFEQMRMSALESQMIEQLRWTAETVCSAFHVPAWKIGVGSMPAYTNPEIANQTYYSDCLQSPIEQWELCMDEALGLTTPVEGRGQMGVELDLDGLLRMDQASQVTTLVAGIRGGLYTPNGARKKISEKPLEGGDTIYLQHQDYPMEMIAKRQDLNPPKPEPAALAPAEKPLALPPGLDEERAALVMIAEAELNLFLLQAA